MRKLDELRRAQKETIGLQIFQRMAVEKNKKEERALRRLGIEPAAISDVAYKIVRADLQAARELYRILVAGGSDAACRFVRELAAGLENEKKTQAEIEMVGSGVATETVTEPSKAETVTDDNGDGVLVPVD